MFSLKLFLAALYLSQSDESGVSSNLIDLNSAINKLTPLLLEFAPLYNWS